MKKLENFTNSLSILAEADFKLAERNDIYRTGIIGQFNLTFELAWKALQEIMRMHSVEGAATGSPREILQLGYKIGFINDSEVWLLMLKKRNTSVHIYNEDETLKKVDYLTADGDIEGRYQQNYEKNYRREHVVRDYDGKSWKIYGFEIGDKNFQLPSWQNFFGQNSDGDLTEIWFWKKKFRLTPTFYLPFSLVYTEYVPYKNVMEDYTDEELKQIADKELQKYLHELEKKGVQIISNSVTISLDAGGGHAKGVLTLNGPIGKEVPIRSQQMAWNTGEF